MGMSTKPIMFFDDRIELDVHTASHRAYIGHTSLQYFGDGQRLSLEEVQETGEFIARREDGAFIHGQEI